MNMNDTMNNKRLENLADMCDSFSSVTALPAYILDVETKEMLYVSRYPMFIAGYTAAEAKAKGKSFFMETCVPEDKEFLGNVLPVMLKFYENLHSSKINHYSATFAHGLMDKKGRSVFVAHQVAPFEVKEDHKILSVLGTMSPAVISRGHDLTIRDNLGLMRWKYDFLAMKWNEYKEMQLSETEKRVMLYVCNGLSIKQIANKLSRTESSIKNTRSKIFFKLGVGSIQEAVMTVLTHRLL